MRHIPIIAIAALCALPAGAQDWDCDDLDNLPQSGLNYCAALDFQKADRALNVAWPIVVERLRAIDDANREDFPDQANAYQNVLKAQRAWIDFRDGQCDAEGAMYTGGTIKPLIVATCKTDLTRDRTEQLLLMIDDG